MQLVQSTRHSQGKGRVGGCMQWVQRAQRRRHDKKDCLGRNSVVTAEQEEIIT